MKRQKVQILALVAALLVLAVVFLGVRYYNKLQADKSVEEDEVIAVVDAVKEDVTAMSYTYEGETLSFELEGNTWYVAGDHSKTLKQYMLTAMAGALAPLTASQKIENVTDLEQYGLADPQTTITVGTDSAAYTVYVGDQNALTKEYYVCLPDEASVYMAASADITRFQKPLEDLVEEEPESEESNAESDAAE